MNGSSTMIKVKRCGIYIILALFSLQFLFSTTIVSEAALYKRPTPVQTSEVRSYSGKYLPEEYFTVRTPLDEKSVIYVSGRVSADSKRLCIRLFRHKSSKYYITVFITPDMNGEFSVKINTAEGSKDVPEIIDNKGTAAKARECWDTRPGYRAVEHIDEGTYHLTIAKAVTAKDADISNDASTKWYEGTLGGSSSKGYIYKEALLTVSKGNENNPKLIKYDTVISNNEKVRNMNEPGSYLSYRDVYMKDVSFVFKDPKTGKTSPMTSSRVSYVKKVSDSITSGASSDMEKLEKIYEYVSENLYYDRLAYEKGKYQYSNPYLNLYNMRNKISSANSYKGKVAATCQGYSSMTAVLARAQGIPARLVQGHHISQPITTWEDISDKNVSRNTHWWTEAYVDGRWITLDTNSATYNRWTRSSFSDSGTWKHSGTATYAFFDPSPEHFSTSFICNSIYKGSTDGKNLGRKSEQDKLRTFFAIKRNGVTNGKRLNKKYSSRDISTWGTGASGNFLTNGYGRTAQISWNKKKLYGSMDLSGFYSLTSLSVSGNNISALKLSGCSSLKKLDASYNSLKSSDTASLSKLTSINLRGNRLSSVKFRHSSKKITISSNSKSGSFGFKYSKSSSRKVTLYINKTKDLRYLGVYSSSGKKLSSKTTYSFTPTRSFYTIKYKKK